MVCITLPVVVNFRSFCHVVAAPVSGAGTCVDAGGPSVDSNPSVMKSKWRRMTAAL